jgi:hypothetical protein
LSLFHVPLHRPLTFTEWYQLHLNRDRALLQKAMTYAWGVGIARGTEPIDLEFFLAICETEEEAKEMQAATNARRKLAKMEAKRKD